MDGTKWHASACGSGMPAPVPGERHGDPFRFYFNFLKFLRPCRQRCVSIVSSDSLSRFGVIVFG